MNKEERHKYMKEYRQKNKDKINLKDRIRKQASRLKDKIQKNEKDNQRITQEMRSGNLNIDMKPDHSFETWTDFKAENPEASKTEYIKAKIDHKPEKTIRVEQNILSIIGNVPYSGKYPSNTCRNFRLSILGYLESELPISILIENHISCDCCSHWRYINRDRLPVKWKGCNLWNNEVSETVRKPESKQKILDEEMKKLYGDKHNHRIESDS